MKKKDGTASDSQQAIQKELRRLILDKSCYEKGCLDREMAFLGFPQRFLLATK